ncbi:ribosome maturation factor RimP [Sediminihabitans luteus]|uniref:Ribosome maturation factor RimP n=1 Tax=Sediminihabitans luteus TaxID=1138585 RepID=A0A2M9CCA2_9CELL|nr:ribosome maturation factor RimP [Sediminihabitans luteus]PJJ69012.1 ribosome maturation factor RimP [Sediminihabitans luteus]GII99397.1 ribosome maturation factor RimP [Sediminihabitans luteus]
MAKHTEGSVRRVVEPVVTDAGLHLEDVAVTSAGARSVVRLTVDLAEDELGSLDLDRVADVSRLVSDALDADGTVSGAYVLEVGTPGTSRPLTELRHFKRARGRLVRVARTDGPQVTARLADVVDGALHLVEDGTGTQTQIALTDVAHANVEVELKRMSEVDLGDDDEEN